MTRRLENISLIPKGTKAFGEYSNSIAYGQSRIFVAWERLIYPNGDALDLGAMPMVDGIERPGRMTRWITISSGIFARPY
jgi:type IV secretory pathway VirB10-like protein